MANMRPGRVVQHRLSPKDCMTVVDILQDGGLLIPGMSFARAVSMAISCAFEILRHNNIVQERDGFEYTELMSHFPYGEKGNTAFNYALTKNIDIQSENWKPPIQQFKTSPNGEDLFIPDPAQHKDPNVRRLNTRLVELELKRLHDPENFDQSEYDQISTELGRLL